MADCLAFQNFRSNPKILLIVHHLEPSIVRGLAAMSLVARSVLQEVIERRDILKGL